MRTLARPIGLGLAARGEVDESSAGRRAPARRARLGLDPRLVLRARRGQLRQRRRRAGLAARRRRQATFRVALGARQPVHPPPGRPGDDRLGARRDGARPDRHGARDRRCRSGSRRWASRTSPTPPSTACPQAMDQLRALWAGERLPSATPGLPPIQPMFPPVHRDPALHRRPTGRSSSRWPARRRDGYLARPAESIPSLRGILERSGGGRARPVATRTPIETAGYLLSLVDETPARGAQPGQARAVRHLHDVRPVRRLAEASRVRRRAARPDRRGLAGRGLPRRPASSSRTSCWTRSCCAGRARTSPPRRMAYHARPGWACRSSSRSSRRSTRSTSCSRAAADLRRSPDADDRRRAVDAASRRSCRLGLADDRELGAASRASGGGSARTGRSCGRSPSPPRSSRSLAGGALAARRRRASTWPLFLAALLGGVLLHVGHEHRQRDLRRPQGHRHDHLAAGQPRHREGPDHRTRRRSCWRSARSRWRSRSACTWSRARLADRRARARSAWSAATSTRRRRSSTSSARSACRSCSCSWAR